MTALALLIKDSTLALENEMECQAQLDIPTLDDLSGFFLFLVEDLLG